LRLGNASPAEIGLQGGSGPTEIDLRGAWRRPAKIAVDVRLGDVTIVVPRRLAVTLNATGRDPADLIVPEFSRAPNGSYRSPAAASEAVQVSIEAGPGIGRIVTRFVD
jgi:hypothetical protein